ncbi:MAG: protein-export rane protein SecD [Vampirovibrio sp.]|jgi:preprotein translocase subunit SecD|nr:protein-export rane protein SecD [Vampirovibrio sp.]
MFKNPKINLLIIVVLVMASIWMVVKDHDRIHLGLDLKGGTRLTLQAEPTPDVPKITVGIMESLQSVIEKRVNSLGVGESVVQRAGENRLIVEIPGVKDPDEAKQRLGRVGKLEFKKLDAQGQWVNSGVSGKDFRKADVSTKQSGEWVVQFELNDTGRDKFGKLTTELAPTHAPLGIFFDDQQVSAPVVNEPIVDGAGIIEGKFTHESAKDLVDTLNAGALPVDIHVVEENTVGPLLGQSSIKQSLFAGLVGLGLVLAFMIGYYRSMGVIASIALLVYTLLTFALFMIVGVTFTLAGIAGFILSIGMAVDANILIFERTREELKAGRSKWKAIEVGFDRAFPSIFDSNTTTLITCLLLWVMGTGSVKGFALTLALGVAVSMFSAITVTRTFLYLLNNSSGQPTGGSIGMRGGETAKV